MGAMPRIISVDDHVLEPPTLWTERLPAAYRERGPRIVRQKMANKGLKFTPTETGKLCDVWYYDDLVYPLMMLSAAVGFDKLSFDLTTYDEVRPGTWKQKERLEDMDQDGVDAALCFPNTFPRFCGQGFTEREDKALALLCVKAYNDWIIDDWSAGAAKGRLIPITIMPLWDSILAAEEVRRCAAKGSFAVAFSENPEPLGLPNLYANRYWDPFYKAIEETETTLCMHIGSSSKMPTTTTGAPFVMGPILDWSNSMCSLLDYIFSGTLERFPKMKIAYSEGQVGWMPYLLERADKIWEEFRGEEFENTVPNPPSSYIPGRVYGCIFDDDTGLRNRDVIGMDQICFETDYPHAQATFPNTMQAFEKLVTKAGLADDEIYKLARANAITAFGLQRFGITK